MQGKKIWAGAAAVVATVGLTAWATGVVRPADETRLARQDAIAQSIDMPSAKEKAFMAAQSRAEARAAKAATLDVGDPDSFGKPVKWLGLMNTPFFQLASSCDGMDPSFTCVLTSVYPGEAGYVYQDFDGLDEITFPGKSLDNFLCHWQTPSVVANVRNDSGYNSRPQFVRVYPVITLSSPVLAAPGLVDPETGEPLNGKLKLYAPSVVAEDTLAAGQRSTVRATSTRTCIGGLLTRASLTSYYGLTSAQVDELFAKPMTLTLGATIFGRGVDNASVYVGYRFTGN